MPLFNSSLITSAADDSTPAEDPVTRSLRWDDGNNSNLYKATGSTDTTWTVAMWVKRSKLSSLQYFFSWGGDGINFDSSDRISIWNGSAYRYTTAVFRDTSSWYQLTISCNAGTITIYVNGVAHALSSSVSYPAWGNVYFGRWSGNTSYNFDGYLADIYGIEGSALDHTSFTESNGFGGLKPKEYTGAFGTNGFHIDAQPAHDADLLVSSIDRNDGDTLFADAAKGHVLTVSGNTHHDNTVGNPFGSGTAMYFDGNGDTIVAAASSDFAFGTGDFTVEGWWYFESIPSSTDAMLIDLRPTNNTDTDTFAFSTDTTNGVKVYSGGNYVLGGSLSTNTWHHIALVRDSGTLYAYIDGTATGTTQSFSNNLTENSKPRLGSTADGGTSAAFTGYIFDVRITKGTARYTTNFSSSLQSAPFELNPVYIGGDQSGNKNHFEPTNLNSTDIREDNPLKNHATWNPLIRRLDSTTHVFTYSEGNTVATYTGGVAHTSTTIASSGVHYAEFAFSKTGSSGSGTSSISGAGVVRARWNDGHTGYAHSSNGCYYGSSGTVQSPDGSHSVTAVGSNRLGIAFDGANNKADFYEVESNGTKTLLKSLTSSDSIDFDGSATFTATSHDNGIDQITGYFEAGEWWGTAPDIGSTTATALNTSNFDDPSVTPSEHFEAKAYEGEGGGEEINLGFTPALTWIKRREDSNYYHGLYDSARGLSAGALASNSRDNEDNTQRVASFDSDTGSEGFTLASGSYDYTNASGKDFISWNWKAHQTPSASASYSDTLTLTVSDYMSGETDGWGNTKLKVYEGTAEIGEVGQPTTDDGSGGYSNEWDIKTNDPQKIKIVWDCDSDFSDWYNIDVSLDDDSSNNLQSYYYDDGDSSTEFSDGDTFYQHSSYSTANESTTGTVVAGGGTTVSSNSEKYNAAAGFTMFTYTGNSDSQSDSMLFNHSLGVPLDFVICKNRDDDSTDWLIWHKDLGDASYQIFFDNYGVAYSTGSSGFFTNKNDDTQHQAELTNIYWVDYSSGSGSIQPVKNNKDFIFYGWDGVEGYSKFGSYTGNGDADGPFIYTGFRPAFVLIKNIGASQDWFLLDNKRDGYNVVDKFLEPNTSNDEDTAASNKADFTANGFKLRGSGSVTNQNNTSFVYACFSESPLKHANAR